MNNKKVLLFSALALSMGLGSCVNSDYDLGNMDNTIGIKVKDLTIAMKMDELKLEKVLDLEDGSEIKKIKDPVTGKDIYAVLEEGDFESDPITIDGFTAESPTIDPITDALPMDSINKSVFKALSDEIAKETNKQINNERDRITKDYLAQYDQAVVDATKDAIEEVYLDAVADAQKNSPIPLTDAQKKAIRDNIEVDKKAEIEKKVKEKINEKLGFTKEDIPQKVSDDVEAKRDSIVTATVNDPKVRKDAQEVAWKQVKDDEVFAKYNISNKNRTVNAESDAVDKALRKLDYVHAETNLNLGIRLTNLANSIKVVIKDTRVQMPKGLDIEGKDSKGKDIKNMYDKKTGILNLGNVDLTSGKYDLAVKVNGFDPSYGDIVFKPGNNAPGHFEFSSTVNVANGEVDITKKDFQGEHTIFDLPAEAEYSCTVEMSDIKVNSIDGIICYEIDEPQIDPVDISDLPDMLSDDGTSLILYDPQIYLSLNNPLAQDNVKARMGLQLTAIRDNGGDNEVCRIDDEYVESAKAQNVFCLAPAKPAQMYPGFEGAEWKSFKSLSNIAKGKGLPRRIAVDVLDPQIPEQAVKNFALGRDLESVKGRYTLYAPLNLTEGSVIEYRDTIDGWYDDTMAKLTVYELKLDAKIISTIPLAATLNITPIDKDGKKISGIECNSIKVAEGTTPQEAHFVLTSKNGMKDLDGLLVHAHIVKEGAEETLKPDDYIKIEEAKVTITGEYIEPDND